MANYDTIETGTPTRKKSEHRLLYAHKYIDKTAQANEHNSRKECQIM